MTALSPRTFLGDESRVMVVAYGADAGSGYRFLAPCDSVQLAQHTGSWAEKDLKLLGHLDGSVG